MISRGKTPLVLCILLVSHIAASAAPVRREDPAKAANLLVEKLSSANASSIRTVLSRYNRIESAKAFDVSGRHVIHERLLKALRKITSPDIAKVAKYTLGSSSKSSFPSQVLLMKAMIGPNFPASREERVRRLSKLVHGKNRNLSTWAVRLLGESRWRESVDELIRLLEEEEARDFSSLLSSILSSELYRVLGAMGRGTAPAIRQRWKSAGKKVPSSPDYSLGGENEVTVAFFGDRISPYSVFVIDTSSSMRQETHLRLAGKSRGATTTKKNRSRERGPRRRKVDIVKSELVRALGGLQPHCRFNILSYSAKYHPWRAERAGLRLYLARQETVKSAKAFAAGLKTATGTNIHDSLEAALQVPGVETVYLLSDGVPSRGGKQPQIEKRAAELNYLRAIRIVTYGFTPEGKGSYDEAFMKRLARNNWGWYRRLN